MPVKGAAFFDVDRTLMAGASALRLAAPFRDHGLLTRRSQVRAALTQLAFSWRGAGDEGIERFAAAARDLIAGWDREQVRRIVEEEIDRRVRPVVYREALDRIAMHHRNGEAVYAVSATMTDIVEPLAALLGLDGAVGTVMEVDAAGRYTGEIAIPCHGTGKADRLMAFAAENDIDLASSSAYSDSSSDEQFLRTTGRPYAVNPDRELRKLAEEEGWGILAFKHTVDAPLHRKRAARASLVVLLSAVAAVLVRRRRR